MQLRAEQLAAHLKKNLAPIYLITGDVPLLQQECCDAIRRAAIDQGYAERLVFQVETGFSWSDFLASTQNLSLFSNQQLLDLRFAPGQLGDAGSKALQAYAARLPTDKILLLSTGKLDATQQKSAWYQAVTKAGVFIQLWPIPTEQLPQWVSQRLAAAGLQADRDGIQLLADRAEGNLLAAAQEIEKLSLLFPNHQLSAEMIAEAVADSARFDVFQLADVVLAGDAKRSLRILQGLQGEGIEAVLILWALTRELRALASMAHQITQGLSIDQAIQKQFVWEKRKPLVRKALQRHPATVLQQLLRQAGQIDLIIKGLEKGNVWNELQRLTLQIAGLKS